MRLHAGYGARAYLATLLLYILWGIDIVTLHVMTDSARVGYYSIAVVLADAAFVIPLVVGGLLFARLSSMDAAFRRWQLARSASVAIAVLMAAVVIVSVLLVGPLVQWLYGAEFIPSATTYAWLAPGVAFLGVNTILINYFASVGMPRISLVGPVMGLLANLVLNIALIPRYGIAGAAIASTLSYGLVLAISAAAFWAEPARRATAR